MSLLDFQLDSMPGIDLVTASALIAELDRVFKHLGGVGEYNIKVKLGE